MLKNLRSVLIGVLVLLITIIIVVFIFFKVSPRNTTKGKESISPEKTLSENKTQPNPGIEKPALWKASKGDAHIWIFGSYHAAPKEKKPDSLWLNKSFLRLLEEANKIYFEADVFSPEGQRTTAKLFSRESFLPKGTTLESLLEEEDQKKLKTYLQERNISLKMLNRIRPWMATVLLMQIEIDRLGYSGQLGVDKVLYTKATESNKDSIDYLETAEASLQALYQLSESEQIKTLQNIIREKQGEMEEALKQLYNAWETGDIKTIDKFSQEEFKNLPELWKAGYEDRNRAWAQKLIAKTKNGDNILVIVGAAHMTGEPSLQHLLEKAGYTIQRVAY